MERILYYGLFLDQESKNKVSALDKNKLDIVTKDFHVTFRYLPNSDERINDIVGKEFFLDIIGIANNGKNSGVLIEIPNELKKIIYIGMKKMKRKFLLFHIWLFLYQKIQKIDIQEI